MNEVIQGQNTAIKENVASNISLIELWLHGKSKHTKRAYTNDIKTLIKYLDNKPFQKVTIHDLYDFSDSLFEKSVNTQARILSAVKSLFTFGHKIGFLTFNVAKTLTIPKGKNTLAERILSESEVHKIIALETNKRNNAILRLLYSSGIRVSELCGLSWKDVKQSNNSGQITIYGKGNKTRSVLLSVETWNVLQAVKETDDKNAPVFKSRKGGQHLDSSQVFRIVKNAAKKAGIEGNVSPHWLRHAHASHSLDKNAPIHLVQQTLGHSNLSTTSRYTHAKPNDSSSLYLSI